jgi:hypothetical protein
MRGLRTGASRLILRTRKSYYVRRVRGYPVAIKLLFKYAWMYIKHYWRRIFG